MEKMKELYEWQTTWDRYVTRTTLEQPSQQTTNTERRRVKIPRKPKPTN